MFQPMTEINTFKYLAIKSIGVRYGPNATTGLGPNSTVLRVTNGTNIIASKYHTTVINL